MPSDTSQPRADEEPSYTRSVFEAILDGMGVGDELKEFRDQYACTDDGASVSQVDSAGSLAWHPWCEVDTPDSRNPLDEPWLRFPFTARQLAALMTDGWGQFIQQMYGDWSDGPNECALQRIGSRGVKAKRALRAAYVAYRTALEMAPRLDPGLDACARELTQQYTAARNAAMEREELRKYRQSTPATEVAVEAEYILRLARVNDSVAVLGRAASEARDAAALAYSRWRRSLVQHLLLPANEVPADAFASPLPVASVTGESVEDRQRRRLHDLRQRFGGVLIRRHGKWELKNRQHGAFGKLVAQEVLNGSSNTSPWSVREDYRAAADAEDAEKRTGWLRNPP